MTVDAERLPRMRVPPQGFTPRCRRCGACRVILHFVAEMRRPSHGEAAGVLAAATLANARRVFNRN